MNGIFWVIPEYNMKIIIIYLITFANLFANILTILVTNIDHKITKLYRKKTLAGIIQTQILS